MSRVRVATLRYLVSPNRPAGIVFQDAWAVAGDGGAGDTWSHRNPAAATGRFGGTRLDYVFVQWHGRGAFLHTEVVPGEHHGQLWASDSFTVPEPR